jgi:hypothetical protein
MHDSKDKRTMRNLNSFKNRKKNYIERNECLVNFYSKNKRAKRDLNCSINRRKKKKPISNPMSVWLISIQRIREL